MDSVKQRIIASVFAKRSTPGAPQETYVSHVKIWEETEEGGKKPRYILLSRKLHPSSLSFCCAKSKAENTAGEGFIHKSKMNTNNTFSIGKTWKLTELRGLEVINVSAYPDTTPSIH